MASFNPILEKGEDGYLISDYKAGGGHIFLGNRDGRTTVVSNPPGEKLDRELLNKKIKKMFKYWGKSLWGYCDFYLKTQPL